MTSNAEHIAAHVDALALPGGVIELRVFGSGAPRKSWRVYEARHELIAIAIAANASGNNCYLGALPRPRIGASGNACIKIAHCVFVDFDGKHLAARDHAGQRAEIAKRIGDACLPEPSMIIFSGHGWHAYWLFDEPLTDMDRWAKLIDSFIATLRSDPACSNEERILRLAGTVNWKAPIALATLDYFDPSRRYAVADLEQPFYHGNLPELVETPDRLASLAAAPIRPASANAHQASVINAFNDRVDARDQIAAAGYGLVGKDFRRPGKNDRGFSGIFRADAGGKIVSVHWSENDPLNDRKFGGRAGRLGSCGIHDAFSAFAMLNHRGDPTAATAAAARMLGIALPRQRRDGDILRAIQSSDDADVFARMFFGEAGISYGAGQVRLAEILRRHTTNPYQVGRLLALATRPTAKGAA